MTQSAFQIWDRIEAGHDRQELLLDELAVVLVDFAQFEHDAAQARAVAATTAQLDEGFTTETARKNWVLSRPEVLASKLVADLAAGRVKVVQERLRVLEKQLGQMQSAFVSWRTP